MDIIENNINCNWHWLSIVLNPNFTLKFVLKHLDYNWNWRDIGKHCNIKMNDIENNLMLNWDWNAISQNPNLTGKFILKHLNKPWNWNYISTTMCLDLNFILSDNGKQLNWNNIMNYQFEEHLKKYKMVTLKKISLTKLLFGFKNHRNVYGGILLNENIVKKIVAY